MLTLPTRSIGEEIWAPPWRPPERADIAVARRRTDRVSELHATLIQGLILSVAGGGTDDVEAARMLDQAEQLSIVSGAAFFNPTSIAP